ncbi:response regulator [Cohnella sp. GCM10012308]|uniref:response regulator transcription factor n=1 Tax=Cohnella sp. GCM10012308 TaxID=3317329 RepID=UPI003607C0BB
MIRVLIVDDSMLIRTSLSKHVTDYSDTMVVSGTASNGVKALEWLELYYADLCITDIRMPLMDGLALIEQINRLYPWMKCMVVSSYDDFHYAQRSMKLFALDYILKPVDSRALNESLFSATSRMMQERNHEAAQLILRKLPLNRAWMERWIEQIQTLRSETMPLLIVETLELLEDWAAGSYYLLNALSILWLQTVVEELSKGKLRIEWDEDEDEDLELLDPMLTISSTRGYFRLCAVRRMEQGSNRLITAMRGIRDNQSTKVVDAMKRYIQVHYGEKMNLQDLAERVSHNKTYMCTLFKQETNMTVWHYIVAERMNHSRDFLLNSSLKVYEIANRVGYEDVDYFTRIFKKHFGLSPLDYKKRMES